MTPKERPILFTGAMVRALLAGTKTQTRRAVKTHPSVLGEEFAGLRKNNGFSRAYLIHRAHDRESMASVCPYGQIGQRIWVRETTVKVEDHGYEGPVFAESDNGRNVIEYGLSPGEDDVTEVEPEEIKLRPSIFMPRAMSRITLEIVSVRVERLQDISEADAIAEGVSVHPDHHGKPSTSIYSPTQAYRDLWESITAPGSWDANPLVWVVKFKRIEP